jgi:hypothetical protein
MAGNAEEANHRGGGDSECFVFHTDWILLHGEKSFDVECIGL